MRENDEGCGSGLKTGRLGFQSIGVADNLQPPGNARRFPGRLLTLRVADVQLHRICDDQSGVLILPMVIFSPWAFGTTQPRSIWTMNVAEAHRAAGDTQTARTHLGKSAKAFLLPEEQALVERAKKAM